MSKYKNTKYNGFDSKKEYKRFTELQLMEKAGEITDLERQVKFVLIPSQRINGKVVERECAYYADFVYYKNGQMIVEDVKSAYSKHLPEYVIKRKLLLKNYGIRISEV